MSVTCHVTCHAMSCHMSCHVMSHVMPCHVTCHAMSCHMSCHVTCDAMSHVFAQTKISLLPISCDRKRVVQNNCCYLLLHGCEFVNLVIMVDNAISIPELSQFSFQFFLLDEWTTYFTRFCEHQAHQNPTSYEPVANLCWKQVLSSFFLYFPTCNPMAETAQGLKGRVLKK
jgi:hypothetical protein